MVDQVFGQQSVGTQESAYNEAVFLFRQLLNKVRYMDLVEVLSVTNAGGLSPVGFVSIRILTNQMTGKRLSVPHGEIFNIPYMRLQGGRNAVILDPEEGDIGAAGFCSRDISAVKNARGAANPGSFRGPGNPADGLYIGGYLNDTPEQYIQFLPGGAGINIVSPTKITLTAPIVEIDAGTSLVVNSPLAALSGAATVGAGLDVTGGATIDGKDFATHKHPGQGTLEAGSTPVTGDTGDVL